MEIGLERGAQFTSFPNQVVDIFGADGDSVASAERAMLIRNSLLESQSFVTEAPHSSIADLKLLSGELRLREWLREVNSLDSVTLSKRLRKQWARIDVKSVASEELIRQIQ